MKLFYRIYAVLFFINLVTCINAANPAPLADVYNGERGVGFNDNWKFNLGDVTGANNAVYNDAGWRNLSLPHDWSIELNFNQSSAAGGGGGYLDGGIGWYRKTFTLPQAYSGKRTTIQFEGIYMNSEVWINGHYLGLRPYGYSSFEYDLTPYLNFGATTNVIAVKVNNNQPNSRWYSGSGIYRDVWLTVTDPVHVAYCGSFVTTPIVSSSSATVAIKTRVQNHSNTMQAVSLVTTIYNKTGIGMASVNVTDLNIQANKEDTFVYNLNIANPILWSIDNPYLYTVKTQVYVNKSCTDNFVSRLGIRYYAVDANNGFSLNGVNVKLHGVCMHHDLGSLGAAQNYRALERQVEVLKSFGCNAIRTSHNPPTPELLEICDRLGLVVMDEAFDCWRQGKNANDYHLYFDAYAQQDVHDWVQRDRNHPSVIMWSIGNEIPEQGSPAGVTIANNLISWVKNDDATRPITQALNNQGVLGDLLNIVGYNYASGATYDNDHNNHPTWRIVGSETSSAVRTRGVYHFPVNKNLLMDADMQCSSYDNSIVSWGHSAEDSWRFDHDRAFVLGQFIWTGFDYIGEPTPYPWPAKGSYFGIVDMCGFPKDIYYFYQSQWTSPPMVHLLPHWNWSSGQTIPVWAYSNCDSVGLFLNGKSLGTRKFKTLDTMHLEWNTPFEPGTLLAFAYKNGSIAAKDSVKTAGTSAKISLKTDRDTIQADGRNMAFIETNLQDKDGNFVPDANNQVSYLVTGPGKIVGVDNGNPISIEPFKASKRQAFNGKCLAIIQSTGAEGQIVVSAAAPPVPVNIALKKPSHADSEDVYVLNNIAVGKFSVAYSEQASNLASAGNDGSLNQWWMVNLGGNHTLTGTQVTWEKDGKVYQYKIDAYINGTWTTVVDKTSNSSTQQTQVDNFSCVASAVEIYVTGLAPGCWASFYEFQVFDGSTTKLSDGNDAFKGNDGNTLSRWSAADGLPGHWWVVDLGSSHNLTATQVTWEHAGNAYQYKIETSTDSAVWSTASDKTGNTNALQVQTDSFNVSARYVRITVTGGVNSNNRASFSEFKVFNGSYTTFAPASVTINAINTPCWVNVSNNGWQQTGSVSVCPGASIVLRPFSNDTTGIWSWKGPNGFTANTSTINLGNLQTNQSGTYTATRNSISHDIKLTVDAIPGITSYININGAGMQQVDSIAIKQGDNVVLSPQTSNPVSWSWTGPNAYAAATREIQFNNIQKNQAGTYTVQYVNPTGCSVAKDIKFTIQEGNGTRETLAENSFEIYPNPAINGLFKIVISGNIINTEKTISIYDIYGKVKREIKDNGVTIEVIDAHELGLSSGIYFVNLKNETMNVTKKVVIP